MGSVNLSGLTGVGLVQGRLHLVRFVLTRIRRPHGIPMLTIIAGQTKIAVMRMVSVGHACSTTSKSRSSRRVVGTYAVLALTANTILSQVTLNSFIATWTMAVKSCNDTRVFVT